MRRVDYEELSDKTKVSGMVLIGRLNGTITNVHNCNFTSGDSLHVNANGYLEDQLYTKLDVHSSYTDSLGGFRMVGSMGPGDLRPLNRSIVALAGAAIKSGWIDTMNMQIIGRNDAAVGDMVMLYHGLKVIITGRDETKGGWLIMCSVSLLIR